MDWNVGKVHFIVMLINNPCNDMGHHLYFDTSPAVLEALSAKKFGAFGTNQSEGMPDQIKTAMLKVGMSPVFYRKDDTLCIAWFDKRKLNLATNLHNEHIFEKQLHARTDDHR